MSGNIVNQVSFLRTSRNFPEDIQQLVVEITKSYIDIATAVNSRTIGLFSTTQAAATGESWFSNSAISADGKTTLSTGRQQSLRRVYNFTAAGNIAHGLNFQNIVQFTKPSGAFTDGTNWYGVIFGSNVAIAGQVSFYITPTNIVILSGGAGTPTITKGTIVLEWLAPV